MTTWDEQFAPVRKRSPELADRPQQRELGQAIIDCFANKVPLIAEAPTGTGKSFAALIPMIHLVRGASTKRGVISTETIALQDQVARKDLPFLQKIYPDFKFQLLKGRSNYVCLENADYSTRGNSLMRRLYATLEARVSQLGAGEKSDAERIIGMKLTEQEWGFLSGSMTFCGENACSPTKCFSSKARALALDADIVVVNHALVQAHIDSDYLLLGQIDYLVIDEAHTFAQVLVDGWTESISEWELNELHGQVSKALDKSRRVKDVDPALIYSLERVLENIHDSLESIMYYYQLLNPGEDWSKFSAALCEKTVTGGASANLLRAMQKVETEVPLALESAAQRLEDVRKHLATAIGIMYDEQIKGIRDIRKGITAAKKLAEFCSTSAKAASSKDGVVVNFGIPFGVIVDGFTRRSSAPGIRIRNVPLDVSGRLSELWAGSSPVLLSATLRDLTDGSFRYVRSSLGFPEGEELVTSSPFDYAQQQLVYITHAKSEKVDTVRGARYSFDELVELLEASRGRALVLFTARGELEDAAERALQLQAQGKFNHELLVQHADSDKQILASRFTSNESSVLFGLKSYFTGVDFPGDTCSIVIICKFPLPRFDPVCRQQMSWWLKRGFASWYEREALTVFQQAAGRLIRRGEDRGVVAVLDQRVVDPGERVYKTARLGVDALGSRVIREVEDVRRFLS